MVFKFGGRLILERSFTYPAAILKLMEKERVTGFPGVPTIYAILLQMDLSPYNLSSLRISATRRRRCRASLRREMVCAKPNAI
jgi:acyl-CoA synthetase (AMP-forming)/AMP-acid ligase II